MTEGRRNRGELFKKYVIGFVARYHHDMELVKIQGTVAILPEEEGARIDI
ncbi:hypothetical protein ACQCT3_00865 [Sutcliffiella horikoshii]